MFGDPEKSLPARGAWIEMSGAFVLNLTIESLPARGAWIEISAEPVMTSNEVSLPARGAWIEIGSGALCALRLLPSLPARGVTAFSIIYL